MTDDPLDDLFDEIPSEEGLEPVTMPDLLPSEDDEDTEGVEPEDDEGWGEDDDEVDG